MQLMLTLRTPRYGKKKHIPVTHVLSYQPVTSIQPTGRLTCGSVPQDLRMHCFDSQGWGQGSSSGERFQDPSVKSAATITVRVRLEP